jgi:hypothetical protein
MGSKYLNTSSGSELFFSFEQQIKQKIDEKWKQPRNKMNLQTTNKINER